jgi:hypothetical protein
LLTVCSLVAVSLLALNSWHTRSALLQDEAAALQAPLATTNTSDDVALANQETAQRTAEHEETEAEAARQAADQKMASADLSEHSKEAVDFQTSSDGNSLSASATASSSGSPFPGDQNTVKTFEGTLKTGIMAIGGETTGIVLRTEDGQQYELDFSKNGDLATQAEKLDGKTVVVTGDYTIREGVETNERHIIQVTALEEAKR